MDKTKPEPMSLEWRFYLACAIWPAIAGACAAALFAPFIWGFLDNYRNIAAKLEERYVAPAEKER